MLNLYDVVLSVQQQVKARSLPVRSTSGSRWSFLKSLDPAGPRAGVSPTGKGPKYKDYNKSHTKMFGSHSYSIDSTLRQVFCHSIITCYKLWSHRVELLVIENTSMEWLGDISCWASSLAGRMIYQALGLADSMGITQVGGHPHCQLPVSQQPDVRAFVNRFLLNNNANVNTTIVYSDGNYTFNLANWINWKIPNFTPQPSTTDDSWSLTSIIIFVVLALPPILIGAAIFYYVRCGARSSRNSNASTNNASLLDDSSAYTLASDAETNNK